MSNRGATPAAPSRDGRTYTPSELFDRQQATEIKLEGLTAKLDTVVEQVGVVFTKIDALANAVQGVMTARPARWDQMLSVVKDAATLFAIVAAGIVYIAGSQSAAELARLDERMKHQAGELSRIERVLTRAPTARDL